MSFEKTKQFKIGLASGDINFGDLGVDQGVRHIFKVILMSSSYAFSNAHATYSDVSAYELAASSDYSQLDNIIDSFNLYYDDNDDLVVEFSSVSWDILNSHIGPTNGALIINDNGSSAATKLVLGYIDFITTRTVTLGGILIISSGKILVS